jgi:hypothetical protein
MSKPNKYNTYVSQKPTDGDPSTRSYKRRKLHNSWNEFYFNDKDMNFSREIRREAWKLSWTKFQSVKEVAQEATQKVNV